MASPDLDEAAEDEEVSAPAATESSDGEEELTAPDDEYMQSLHDQLRQEVPSSMFGELRSARARGASYTLLALFTWLYCFLFFWKVTNVVSDNAMNTLLAFLCNFFTLMPGQDRLIASVGAGSIPASMYMLRKALAIDRDDFIQYCVCTKCTKIYEYQECLTVDGKPKYCTNVRFKKGKYSKHCGGKLLKEVKLKDGKSKFVALKTYCFKSVVNTLESFLQRPGFEDACSRWKSRTVPDGCYADIYDGNIWKRFQKYDNQDFLNTDSGYGFILNVDWFMPFERIKNVSVGVIYMVCLNLPREMRFKRENVVLVGIVPSLESEPHSLQYFLEPLTEELKIIWKGVNMKTQCHPSGVSVRGALLCAAADIPAARKLCGFLGHSAKLGCSQCLKPFPGGF